MLCFVHWLLLLFRCRFGDKGKNFGFKDCAVNDAVASVGGVTFPESLRLIRA